MKLSKDTKAIVLSPDSKSDFFVTGVMEDDL